MKSLVILGAGGCARDTLDVVDAINDAAPQFDVLGYIVDLPYGTPGDLVNDKPILGDFTWLERHPNVLVVGAVGASELRRRMVLRAAHRGMKFASLIHPSVPLNRGATIGIGTVILFGCHVSNRVHIGDHVHVSVQCSIGHDTIVDNFVTISPGAHISGNVHLKEGADIGTGVNIVPKKTVGEWSIVGAGACVVKEVPANTTVVGVPAQVIKEHPAGWHTHEH
jgi:sugar O-acyltransferase (sialic acid O-acetyltransferase NeuD family)